MIDADRVAAAVVRGRSPRSDTGTIAISGASGSASRSIR